MEPTSPSASRSPSIEPTPEEIAAGASLPREVKPQKLESRAEDAPPAPPAAVKKLVDEHSRAPHGGVALGVGVSGAIGLGVAVGGEVSVGVVVDVTDPKVSVFVSSASGVAAASGVSVGASTQVSLVKDLDKFSGAGAEHGLNLPGGGLALNHSIAEDGRLEPNGVTESLGPSVGVDAHYYEGTTERWSLSWDAIKNAVKQVAGLPGLHRFGP